MKNSFIIYILFVTVGLASGVSAKSQDQKKPSERSFTQEMSKIKTIQTERAKLIDQTKTQTAETATRSAETVPVKTENQNSQKVQQAQATKPSSGEMRKPGKPKG